MNRQNATKSRTNKTKNNKHPRRAGRDVARRASSRPSPDADHPVPRSIVFLSIGTSSSRVPPVPSSSSSSSSSRARAFKVTPTRTSKEETTRSRARRTVDGFDARAESAFAKMRSAWGIRLTVHNSTKWVWTFACKAQSREIDRSIDRSIAIRSVRVRIHSMIDRWNFHFDRAWTRFDRWKCPITGIDRWFLWFRFGFRWFDGVANRSRRLIDS